MSEALYRKYRPQTFSEVVGQKHIERTLKNAIEQDKVSHAYLFCGPRGTGKTTSARLLAKALLCKDAPTIDPCGTCEDCEQIAEGVHPDVYELDAASRTGVDNVREEIIARVNFAPTRGRVKIYIIDEVHMLSTPAFNALLKTLEEPPSHVIFILCTTDPQKVPATIQSRCQRFDFHRISPEEMVVRLGTICEAEGATFEGEALELIAQRAEGGMRNALTTLEQLIAFGDGAVTMAGAEDLLGSLDSDDMGQIMTAIGMRDARACFSWVAHMVDEGADLAQFARDLASHARNLYVMSLTNTDVALDVDASERAQLVDELGMFGPDRLARMLGVLGDVIAEMKISTNPRLTFEIALTRLIRPQSDLTLESLAERIEALESGVSAVAVAQSIPALRADVAALAQQSAPAAQATAAQVSASQAGAAQIGARSAQVSASQEATAAQVAAQTTAHTTAQTAAAQASAVPKASSAAPANSTNPLPTSANPEVSAAQAAAAAAVARATARARGVSSPNAPASNPGTATASTPAVSAPAHQAATTSASQTMDALSSDTTQRVAAGATNSSMSEALVSALKNPAALQRGWRQAVAYLKKEKPQYGVMFVSVRANWDDAVGRVHIQFPKDNVFAFSMAQKPEVSAALKDALVHAFGEAVSFDLMSGTLDEDPTAFGGSSAGTKTPAHEPAHAESHEAPAHSSAQSKAMAAAAAAVARATSTARGTTSGSSVSSSAPASQSEAVSAGVGAPDPASMTRQGSVSHAPQAGTVSQASSSPEDFDDRPPIDSYEDMYIPSPFVEDDLAAPADVSTPPTASDAFASASSAVSAASASTPVSTADLPAAQSAPAASAHPAVSDDEAPLDADALGKMLSDTMGGTIVFTEVEE